MKVGQLRAALEGVGDDLEVIVRAFDDENDYIGTITMVAVENAHDEDDTPFLAIDCSETEDEADGQ